MEALQLKQKLINKFNLLIKDESKWQLLNDFFEVIDLQNANSLISDERMEIVNERREEYLKNENIGLKWDEVKELLKQKYKMGITNLDNKT